MQFRVFKPSSYTLDNHFKLIISHRFDWPLDHETKRDLETIVY